MKEHLVPLDIDDITPPVVEGNGGQSDTPSWEQQAKDVADVLAKSCPQLRPLSEAGDVPEGYVRVTGHPYAGLWYIGWQRERKDTHFADIRLPSA